MRKKSFWSAVEKKAQEIGFSEIGFSGISDISDMGEHLENWLQNGFHGDMEYMERTKNVRKDPRGFLPNVKSVIVRTVGYYHDRMKARPRGRAFRDDDGIGGNAIIARYAAGRDYHKVIKKMLFELQEFIRAEYFPKSNESDFRLSLDAHPVMEKVWAEKAKLGFLGKNSCLITQKSGSWVLIGCIFTTVEIPRDDRKSSGPDFSKLNCGNCTRCTHACPTGAIVRPGLIDARKCIPYLTIENKGGIPVELREKIGNRIFGCDICQEVCPYNIPRQGKSPEDERLLKNPMMEKEIAGTQILISEILEMDSDEKFLKRFAGSPLMRAKRRGMIRNACIVAGNSGNAEFLPLLQKVIDRESDPMLKEHAEWGINQLRIIQLRITN
ncbi:tRNA epoxyqueuosine(34) reductase QueG [Candidatus Peregrinibacteria bacterium]|nr:tRNA epoxyqueuosine(34) reductase QueG [Candidatus Peregrinibacteria bacterium]